MSMASETKYLYSKENTSLYKDFLDEHNQSKCMYSRNLIAIMDSHGNGMSAFYENHLLSCKSCQEVAKSSSLKSQKIRAMIPKVEVPAGLSSRIKSELKEAVNLHHAKFVETSSNESVIKLLSRSFRELTGNKLILKSLFQGSLLALFTYLLLLSVS